MIRRGAARARALTAACAAAAILGACQEPQEVKPPVRLGSSLDFATSRVRGGENGLEVVQWSIAAPPPRVVQVLEAHESKDAFDPAVQERLRHNGLHISEVPIKDLPATLTDLGGTLADMRNWHGQVPEWRELVRVELPDGQALLADGRVRRLPGGSLRMSMRGWTLPMEDGGLFCLELAPHLVQQNDLLAAVPGSRDQLRGEAFGGAAAGFLMRRDRALLLYSDPPVSSASGGEGPDSTLPPTLGEILLPAQTLPVVSDSPAQERSTVYVLIARLPDSIFPEREAKMSAAP